MRILSIALVSASVAGCASSDSNGWGDPGTYDGGGGGSSSGGGSGSSSGSARGGSGSGGSSSGGGSGGLGGSSSSGGGSGGGSGSSSSGGSSGGSSGSSGSSGGSSGGSSSSGSGSSSGGGSGSSSGGTSSCVYPAGPYGIAMGAVLDPTLTWHGYLPGGTAVATLQMTDLYDCDKSKGINALLFDQSAAWCGACQQEAQDLEGTMTSSWKAEGVYVVTLMAQDVNSNDATTQTASDWKSTYGLSDVAVVADPKFSLMGQGGGLPTNVLVDPRTMKVVSSNEGYGGPDPSVDQLAQKNK